MADVKANELTPETSATLNGTEQFVMFDTAEGKRCTVNDIFIYQRAKQGCTERKYVRCNDTSASSDKIGFRYKQEVTWANMTADDKVFAVVSAGAYYGRWGVESASGKAILWFVTQPATSVYITIYREVTTSV